MFFDQLASLFDYLPEDCRLLIDDAASAHASSFIEQVEQRYESRRYNLEWPLLPPQELFLAREELQQRLQSHRRLYFSAFKLDSIDGQAVNGDSHSIPQLTLQANAEVPDKALRSFIGKPTFKRILFSAESPGRREFLNEILRHYSIHASAVDSWQEFRQRDDERYFLIASDLQQGMTLPTQGIAVITESQLFGERAVQRRRRKYRKTRDPNPPIQSLADLQLAAPVVHEDHGVGRYRGLETLTVGGIATEFLCIEYANEDKLYVPVSSLHLISRYAGASEENAPLHRLGGDRWQRSRKKAQQKIHDIAVELLDIQARREATQGFAHAVALDEYQQFASEFPFEETPDQQTRDRSGYRRYAARSSRWIASSAAMSVSARPRFACARSSSPPVQVHRSRCCCRPRYSPSSTTRTSSTALPTGRFASPT